jgi:hypothetical protein
MSGGVFLCMGPVLEIQRNVPPREWKAAIDALPDGCEKGGECVHGSCRKVAYEYLAGLAPRIRAHREAGRRRAEREALGGARVAR